MHDQTVRLRDRDAIVTNEGIIFRVYGYDHPPNAYVCDPEYAPQTIYISTLSRAGRKAPEQEQVYYKFYFDKGLHFVEKNYPEYTIFYAPLEARLVGVRQGQIKKARNPQQRFGQLVTNPPKDKLVRSLQTLFAILKARTTLSMNDFGAFGSLLHGFYHPLYSDIDLIIYGEEKHEKLRELLGQIYEENNPTLRNEFENEEAIKGKHWRFKNYTIKEYLWHQHRKLIYALFKDRSSERTIKAEFEPVRAWHEIRNEYSPKQRITREGWVRVQARVTEDKDAPFMPSIYEIEPIEITNRAKTDDVRRILSYVEEFRMQAKKDEKVIVEGHLEKVTTEKDSFRQITLTYGPRYYEQVLKVAKPEP
jgi:predicted nucleotidyltransferase